jgi:hypothetical protein
MQSAWILGAGQFGEKAVMRLRLKHPEATIVAVDLDRAALQSVAGVASAVVREDGVEYLAGHLTDSEQPDWIVAAVPVHVAFEWVKIKLSPAYQMQKLTVPEALTQNLGCVVTGEDGTVYTSMGEFTCPDNCPEPADRCFVTGKPRPIDLQAELRAAVRFHITPVVVSSCQLLPGVGGYRPVDLFDALAKIKACKGPVLLATACRCHSVLDAFRVLPRPVLVGS